MPRKLVAALFVVLILAGAGAFYRFALPGLSSARPSPPKVEVAVATWLLRHSVPPEAAAMVNPLKPDEANIAAGAALFQQRCAVCHGFDGGGRTTIGENVYPRVPSLRDALPSLTEGQIFTFIHDGIRNTAMPAWNLPDREIWQIVSFLRHLPPTAEPGSAQETIAPIAAGAHYVGSAACESCHKEIFGRWRRTRMANVVRDPREHPDAIIPDFSQPNPVLTFTKDDVAFVYGSRWKQRYFTRRGDDFFPLPAQWDVTHARWLPYHVPKNADWWAPLYPDDNMQRPTGPLCDGCHSVNYDIKTKSVTEWNVGCESCHGPGSAHVAHPVRATIVNPARLDFVAASDTCIRCHSQGRPPGESDRRQILRLAGRLSHGVAIVRLLGARGSQGGRTVVHALPGRNGAQEQDAGQRFRPEPDVHARRDLLLVPRSARQRQRRDVARERQQSLPDLSRPECSHRTVRDEHFRPYASQAGQHRQPMRLLPHAADRGDAWRRQGARAYLPLHHSGRDPGLKHPEPVHIVPRGQVH